MAQQVRALAASLTAPKKRTNSCKLFSDFHTDAMALVHKQKYPERGHGSKHLLDSFPLSLTSLCRGQAWPQQSQVWARWGLAAAGSTQLLFLQLVCALVTVGPSIFPCLPCDSSCFPSQSELYSVSCLPFHPSRYMFALVYFCHYISGMLCVCVWGGYAHSIRAQLGKGSWFFLSIMWAVCWKCPCAIPWPRFGLCISPLSTCTAHYSFPSFVDSTSLPL